MKTKAVSLFRYWKDGNTDVAVNPDPPSATEAKPFHVVIRGEGWIPVSILVFARDESHALSRVRQSITEVLNKSYKDPFRGDHARRFLAALDGQDSDMAVEVRLLNTDVICAQVNWASNGGLI